MDEQKQPPPPQQQPQHLLQQLQERVLLLQQQEQQQKLELLHATLQLLQGTGSANNIGHPDTAGLCMSSLQRLSRTHRRRIRIRRATEVVRAAAATWAGESGCASSHIVNGGKNQFKYFKHKFSF